MRSPRSHSEHREAVSRRLAQLGAELSVLGAPADPLPAAPAVAGSAHTRIRPGRPGAPSGPVEPVGSRVSAADSSMPLDATVPTAPLTDLPQPGRHAARRRGPGLGRALGAALGERIPGRVVIGPAQLSVLAVAAAVALAVTCWWLLRSGAQEVPVGTGPVLMSPVPMSPGVTGPAGALLTPTGSSPGAGPAGEPAMLVVDVAGRVRRPGIAVLEPGSRVVDALEAAGGAGPGVDLSSLNLARPLVDGEQILVGRRPGPFPPGPPSGPAGAPAALVNLNTAGQAELESLPQIGPVTAGAIIAWRDEHGAFTAVDQLLDVDGIGEATLSQVASLVTV